MGFYTIRVKVNVTPGATELVNWYKVITPAANEVLGTQNLVHICHMYLSSHVGPIGLYTGVTLRTTWMNVMI